MISEINPPRFKHHTDKNKTHPQASASEQEMAPIKQETEKNPTDSDLTETPTTRVRVLSAQARVCNINLYIQNMNTFFKSFLFLKTRLSSQRSWREVRAPLYVVTKTTPDTT